MSQTGVALRLERVTKRYGDHRAVDDVSLEIGAGRFVTLLGPSGSGKTTLLMLIAGFAQPSSGRILLSGRDITGLPPEQRAFGMVFQGYALFPHLTVAGNLAFPLRLRKRSRAEIAHAVDRMLDLVRLPGLGQRMPADLSGGQQQRVALARALIFDPPVLLLDESLSALDKSLRAGLQEELRELHTRLCTTFVFVTHDQDEAMSMSDEVVVINHGRIVQQGASKTLYDRPRNRFVAEFLGRANFIDARITGHSATGLIYRSEGHEFHQVLPGGGTTGEPVLIGLRPERTVFTAAEPQDGGNKIAAVVLSSTYEGADYYLRLTTPIGPMQAVLAASGLAAAPARGAQGWLSWPADASVVLSHEC